MASLLESVMNQIGSADLQQLGGAAGVDESAARKALTVALPMILAGLARNASRPDGASALDRALAKDHDGGLLDNLSDYLDRGDTSPGNDILGHVFGKRTDAVGTGVSRASGIDQAQAAKLMAMAAPLVMAALGRQRRRQKMDAGELGRMLEQQNRAVHDGAPQFGGLARMLDADGDGSVADDVLEGLGKLFAR